MVFDKGGEGEVVEKVGEISPHVRIAVLAEAFVVEAVHLRDLPRFVVTAEDCYSIAVPQLESDEEGDSFDGVIASVNVISHEEVVCVGRVAADAEEFRKIMLDTRVEGNGGLTMRSR